MTATYQTTANPYALKQVYGKDVCEIMRRVNALEARTVPLESYSEWNFPSGYEYMLACNGDGSIVWVLGYKLHEQPFNTTKYRINLWTLDPADDWAATDHGVLYDSGGGSFNYQWPNIPLWCGCDGSGHLYIRANWAHSATPGDATKIIRVSPSSGAYTTHNVSGWPAMPSANIRYRPIGEVAYSLIDTREAYCWCRPVTGGIEVHAVGGFYGLSGDGWLRTYQIETYNTGMALTDLKIYSRPTPPGVGVDVYGTCYCASEDYVSSAAGAFCIPALIELDVADDYDNGTDIPTPGMDAYAPGGLAVCAWDGAGSETSASGLFLGPAFGGVSASFPVSEIVRIDSAPHPVTGEWIHTSTIEKRLANIGPSGAFGSYGRCIRSSTDSGTDGRIIGAVYSGGESRIGRWRVNDDAVEQTEFYARQGGGTKQSLGTPDGGVLVPANNALVTAKAVTAAEHIIDMREAIARLIDDYWCGFFLGRRTVGGALSWLIAAFEYADKFQGGVGGQSFVSGAFDNIAKPALYVALENAKYNGMEYGLELQDSGVTSPNELVAAKYWEYRKADADAMDSTPMHDIDIGEVRSLVDFLDASYNNDTLFPGYSDEWVPYIDWR